MTKLAPKAFVGVAAIAIALLAAALGALGAPKPSLSFTTPPRTTAAGASSETITVALPSGLSGPATVKLSSSGSTGSFRDAADTSTITSVSIASGQNQASFRYRNTVAGKPTVTATAMSTASKKQWSGNVSASQVETIVPAGIDHLALAPASATVASGVAQSYTATGFDRFNNSLGNVTVQTTFSIAPNGSCTGAKCSALLAGAHTVTGTDGAASGNATLTVNPGPLDHLTLAPQAATIAAGGSQSYKAEGFDAAGNDIGDVTAKTTFSISPDGSCSAATCQAQKPGTHTVTGRDGTAGGQASLSVVPGALARIAISPPSATIEPGASQSYSVEGFDAVGNDLGDVTAQSTFTITPDGSCLAASCSASQDGAHVVTAADGGFEDQVTLQVEGGAPTTVSLTFDDGRADQVQAGQILDEHGMVGTFFPITGRVGKAGYMTLSDLQALAAAGNEIGDHTVNHLNLETVDREEAERQVCDARVQLESWGFHVYDFAYPQGGTTPELEEVVEGCGLNSARIVSDLVSPGACSGCAYAETIPPQDPYKIRTPDSIKATTSLAELEGLVTQAQEHGGGWVPLVFHHVCDECDAASIDPETFSAFLEWLADEAGNGVSVKTIHEVVGGADQPTVSGPVALPPSGPLPVNPSLETDEQGDGVPDCWTIGASGVNTFDATRTTDAHSGAYAEQVSISSFTSGDRRLITTQDLGQCAPPASPTNTYTTSAYLKGEGSMRWVAYTRDSSGSWSFWAQGPLLTVGSIYAPTSWTTPQAPAGTTAISVGISLRSVGTFTADDFQLVDNGPSDQTPPEVSITAPPDGSTVEGTTPITAQATDNLGVASVRFFLDGVSLGSKTSPTEAGGSTYRWNWDTSGVSEGVHTLTAVATDTDGNQTTSEPVSVEVVPDTTAPATSILCNGSSSCGGWLKAPVSVSLKATDNVGVAATYYTTDGSEPSEGNGTLYGGPFSIASTTTVSFRSVDEAGNWETAKSQSIQVDGQAPASTITAPPDGSSATGTVPILDEATDNVGVASVRFFLDGVSLGSKTSPTEAGGSTYRWNWDTSGVSEGVHTLTAVATDLAGNQATSSAVEVTVVPDTTPPVTTILCNGSATTCGSWFKAAVSVTMKATDDVGVAGIYYTTDGSEPSEGNGTLYAGAFSLPATTTVRYRAVDTSGNWETAKSQSIQVDTQAPNAEITSPANEATVSGTVPILAQATDNVTVSSVRFFLDGVSLGSKTSPTEAGGSTYRWNWETATVTKGQHGLKVVATDQAGNQTTSATVTVTVG